VRESALSIPVIFRRALIPQSTGWNASNWCELDQWKQAKSSRPAPKFWAALCFSRRSKPSESQGDSVLGEFSICTNRNCRFLVSLREGNKLLRRSDLILSACPECHHEWSGRCPFCVQTLEVIWQSKVPCCAHCNRPLKADATQTWVARR
jgi:hypothetical protein